MIRVVLDLPTVADVVLLASILEAAAAREARFRRPDLAEAWWEHARSIREGLDVLEQLTPGAVR